MSGRGNPNHDEKGRFTDGPSGGAADVSKTGFIRGGPMNYKVKASVARNPKTGEWRVEHGDKVTYHKTGQEAHAHADEINVEVEHRQQLKDYLGRHYGKGKRKPKK